MKKLIFTILIAFSFCLINSGDTLAKRTVKELHGEGVLGDFDGKAIYNKKGEVVRIKGTITTTDGEEAVVKMNRGGKITIKPKK